MRPASLLVRRVAPRWGVVRVLRASLATTAPTHADPRQKRLRVYTRTGDKGKSSLYTGERRLKTDVTFAALGDTDELNAAIGIAREHLHGVDAELSAQLVHIQSRLLDIGSAVATPVSSASPEAAARARFPSEEVVQLERWIDAMDEELPLLRSFILPSGGLAASHLHLARTVCRRAERSISPLCTSNEVPPEVGRYMNRLSDYLFTAARLAALRAGASETIYKKSQPAEDA